MCTVCGLPSNHVAILQTAGYLTVFFFLLTTFIGAWWIILCVRLRTLARKNSKHNDVCDVEA